MRKPKGKIFKIFTDIVTFSGQNKKFKLKYLINKTLERKTTNELVLQFKRFFT